MSPDNTLLTTERDNHTLLWKTDNPPIDGNNTPLEAKPNEMYGSTPRFVISPNSQMAIVAQYENITFYRLSDQQEVGAIPVSPEELAISLSGDRLALIVKGQIQIWEIGS